VLLQHLGDGVAGPEPVKEGVEPRLPKLFDFFPALGQDVVSQGHERGILLSLSSQSFKLIVCKSIFPVSQAQSKKC
jgi:hypothetical protein